jgi:hypothetical protein
VTGRSGCCAGHGRWPRGAHWREDLPLPRRATSFLGRPGAQIRLMGNRICISMWITPIRM